MKELKKNALAKEQRSKVTDQKSGKLKTLPSHTSDLAMTPSLIRISLSNYKGEESEKTVASRTADQATTSLLLTSVRPTILSHKACLLGSSNSARTLIHLYLCGHLAHLVYEKAE